MSNPQLGQFLQGLSEETVQVVLKALEKRQKKKLLALVQDMHPADVAELLLRLPFDERQQFLKIVKNKLSSEVLAEVSPQILEEVLAFYSAQDIATAIQSLESDDAVAILRDLEQEQQIEVLEELEDEDRLQIIESLKFEEDSAGRLIQREILFFDQNRTVEQVFKKLQSKSDLPELVHEIFVVNRQKELVGSITLVDLIKSIPKNPKLHEISAEISIRLSPTMKREDVVYLFKHYALVMAPVVDEYNHLLGVITADDVLHVLDEEADEDFLHLGRVGEGNINDRLFPTILSRLRWLFVTFINTLIASSVLYHFEHVIEKYVALAILMPIVAAMGGNAGMQAVTLTVRGLATKMINPERKGFFKRSFDYFGRESLVGLCNGLFFAVILATITSLWYHDLKLGLVLGAAMVFNMVWACLAGTFIPILIHRIGFDPAISAGPFLTTTTDVLGFSVFLGLSSFFLV